MLALVKMAGVKFDAHYNATTVDPPELVRFIRQFHPETGIIKPKYSMRELIIKAQFPPTRNMRYCCAELKEQNGKGRIVVTGVRWAGSLNRRKKRGLVNIDGAEARQIADELGAQHRDTRYGIILNSDNDESRMTVERCIRKGKMMVNPIIDWEDADVWEFIKAYKIPYCGLYDKGIKRLGCVCCPMSGREKRWQDLEDFPQFRNFYVQTFEKMLEVRRASGKRIHPNWKDGESVLQWWIDEPGIHDERQTDFFDMGEVDETNE